MAIGGVLTAMVTPFDADGALDEAAASRLMRHLLDNGSDGLVLAGTTGEGSTLDDEEKLRLWQLAVDECGDAPVIAGTGLERHRPHVHLTEQASELGVDAMLVVTPYYNKPNRRGITAHFEAVAAATDKPIVVYNIPSRCVIDIPNDLLRELAEIDNVSAVKQARDEDIEPIDGLDLLAGNDDMLARRDGRGRHRRHPRRLPPVRPRDEADRRGARRRAEIDEPLAALRGADRHRQPDPGQDRARACSARLGRLPAADGGRVARGGGRECARCSSATAC